MTILLGGFQESVLNSHTVQITTAKESWSSANQHFVKLFFVNKSYASVNSSCAHAPPRANPRALAICFSWMANSRGWGHSSCQMPRGVDEGRGQMPRPRGRTSPINTAAVFIHYTIIPLSAFLCVIFHFCRPTSRSSVVCNGTIRC